MVLQVAWGRPVMLFFSFWDWLQLFNSEIGRRTPHPILGHIVRLSLPPIVSACSHILRTQKSMRCPPCLSPFQSSQSYSSQRHSSPLKESKNGTFDVIKVYGAFAVQ
ncbi:hypothetical protein ACTXT7_003981 [Hymenolepis weldensis]